MQTHVTQTCIITGSSTKKESMYISTMLFVVARLSRRHSAWKGPSVRPSIWKAIAMTIAAMTNVYLRPKLIRDTGKKGTTHCQTKSNP